MIYGETKKRVEKKGVGTFSNVAWEKTLKTKKGVDDVIQKHSEVVGRFGIRYENMKSTIAKRGVGVGGVETEHKLPWGEWIDKNFIGHKGNTYLRIYLLPNCKVRTTYYKNGVACSKADIRDLCLASEFSSSGDNTNVFTINTDNIIGIK